MYKFLKLKDNKIVSGYNEDFVWEVGKWYKTKGNIVMCRNGFHCSKNPLDALNYVSGEVLAEIETSGKSIIQSDKQCWQNMKLTKAYYWTKKDSIKLAIYSAELVIDIYEKKYPLDDRPRKAIEAAKRVSKKNTAKNRAAARAAAWAAARAAARAAAWAAARAAEAVEAAADKINSWIINYIKELKEYEAI